MYEIKNYNILQKNVLYYTLITQCLFFTLNLQHFLVIFSIIIMFYINLEFILNFYNTLRGKWGIDSASQLNLALFTFSSLK